MLWKMKSWPTQKCFFNFGPILLAWAPQKHFSGTRVFVLTNFDEILSKKCCVFDCCYISHIYIYHIISFALGTSDFNALNVPLHNRRHQVCIHFLLFYYGFSFTIYKFLFIWHQRKKERPVLNFPFPRTWNKCWAEDKEWP